MYFLLSGEGPTDIGLCPDNTDMCEGDRPLPGPMAIIVSQKNELAGIFGGLPSRENLCEMVKDGTIDPDKIDMPSFQSFKRTLLDKL